MSTLAHTHKMGTPRGNTGSMKVAATVDPPRNSTRPRQILSQRGMRHIPRMKAAKPWQNWARPRQYLIQESIWIIFRTAKVLNSFTSLSVWNQGSACYLETALRTISALENIGRWQTFRHASLLHRVTYSVRTCSWPSCTKRRLTSTGLSKSVTSPLWSTTG